MARGVLVTGADGFIGRGVVRALAAEERVEGPVVAVDVRSVAPERRIEGVVYRRLDVRSRELPELLERHEVGVVVHLASIVNPPPGMSRDAQYGVDVIGTTKVLDACLATGVSRIVVTSSGAAYGYHADSPALLTEEAPLRGNAEFAYSHHKRLVEEILARYRAEHPELEQLVLRPGTVLGASVSNQITAIFERPVILGLAGCDTPFVFVWDEDLVRCIVKGVVEERSGIYNVTGDGVLTLREIAVRLGKRYVALDPALVERALALGTRLGLSPYGPEQVRFLRYRPVLSAAALERDFGYVPELDTRGVFELYCRTHGHGPR